MTNQQNNIVLENAYNEALNFARRHYENFPVVSYLVPKKLRKHVAVIYWFARTADDIADEGNIPADDRLAELKSFEIRLADLLEGDPQSPLEAALLNTIKTNGLSQNLFFDLLSAFRQDVTKKRYASFDELLDYCRRSANPVGRLILELSGIRDEKAFSYSDKICTALQLTNFYQDASRDIEKGRIYFPLDEAEKFGATEKMFELKENNLNLRELVRFSVERAQNLFNEGKKLFGFLNGRLKYEIIWTVKGGEFVLDKIRKNNFNVLRQRPSLSKSDFLFLLLNAILKR